jgi:hypothetical protein
LRWWGFVDFKMVVEKAEFKDETKGLKIREAVDQQITLEYLKDMINTIE